MAELPPIPIPWPQRWRYIRFQLLPFGFFLICASLTGWLWSRHFGTPNAVGEVFANRADITSSLDGTLGSLDRPVQLFQRVAENDIVARIHNPELVGELHVLTTDLTRLVKSLDEVRETVRVDNLKRLESVQQRDASDKTRISIFIQDSQIKYLQTQVLIETDRAELIKLNEMHALFEKAEKSVPLQDKLTVERDRDLREKRIEQNKKLLAGTLAQINKAKQELNTKPQIDPGVAEPLLATIRAEIETQRAMIDGMKQRIDALEIRTPISGVVTAIYAHPGAQVTAGLPIMTIAATDSQYVVSYIRQGRNVEPKPGMAVDIHPRTLPVQPISARIEHVGPQIELVPEHQRRVATVFEWGQLVRIPLPVGVALRPGELVDIRIKADTILEAPGRSTADKPATQPDT